MQKKPLSHAQVAFVVVVGLALNAPGFYLAFVKHQPWLMFATFIAAVVWERWRAWKKQGARQGRGQ